jgi:hypothetical protein
MKIRPVGAELFHVDGRTDMKLRVAFRNFANAPKNDREVETVFTKWLIMQVRELSNRVQRSSCYDDVSLVAETKKRVSAHVRFFAARRLQPAFNRTR